MRKFSITRHINNSFRLLWTYRVMTAVAVLAKCAALGWVKWTVSWPWYCSRLLGLLPTWSSLLLCRLLAYWCLCCPYSDSRMGTNRVVAVLAEVQASAISIDDEAAAIATVSVWASTNWSLQGVFYCEKFRHFLQFTEVPGLAFYAFFFTSERLPSIKTSHNTLYPVYMYFGSQAFLAEHILGG